MASDLSAELVEEEILSRVPATSLKRLRSACKQWNALFEDERFAKKHCGKAAKQFMVLMLKENRVYSINVNLHEIQQKLVATSSIKCKGEYGLRYSHNNTLRDVYISRVFHCEGLLLCTMNDYSIVVWNPCLGETRWIQHKTFYKHCTWFCLGYQNISSSCRNYKILKYWSYKAQNGRVVYEFEIFELSSGTWRVLDVVNPVYIILTSSVSLKGNTYWVAYKNIAIYDTVVLSFDFSTERFRPICLPFQDYVLDTIVLSVVREDKLVLLHQNFKELKLDIWVVTTNIDPTKDLSWSKFLALEMSTHHPLFSCNLTFFIDEEKKVAMWFGNVNKENIVCIIGDDAEYREFSLEESTNNSPFVFNYVPSLVHIQQNVERKLVDQDKNV